FGFLGVQVEFGGDGFDRGGLVFLDQGHGPVLLLYPGGERFRVGGGEVGADHAEICGDLAAVGEFSAGDEGRAARGAQLPEHRVPHEGRVDVAALPGSQDVWGFQVEECDVVDGEAGFVEGGDEVVVGSAGEGGGGRWAGQIGCLGDAVGGDGGGGVFDGLGGPTCLGGGGEGAGPAGGCGGASRQSGGGFLREGGGCGRAPGVEPAP